MKYYFKEDTAKFINARKLVGMEEIVEELGYVDFLGKGQYNLQLFHVLVKQINENQYRVVKTISNNKKNTYLLQDYILVSEKGSNEILIDYLQEEVEVNV